MSKDKVKTELTKENLITLQNLLYTGKWNLSARESDEVVKPLINKLAKMVDEAGKLPEKK